MYYYKLSDNTVIDIEKIISIQPQGTTHVLITFVGGSTISLRTQEATYSIKGFNKDGSIKEYEVIKGCMYKDTIEDIKNIERIMQQLTAQRNK